MAGAYQCTGVVAQLLHCDTSCSNITPSGTCADFEHGCTAGVLDSLSQSQLCTGFLMDMTPWRLALPELAFANVCAFLDVMLLLLAIN